MLDALVKVINREIVETRAFLEAHAQFPDPVFRTGVLGQRDIIILAAAAFVFALFLILAIMGILPGAVGGVAFGGLVNTLLIVGYAVAFATVTPATLKIITRFYNAYAGCCVFLVPVLPIWIFNNRKTLSFGTVLGGQFSFLPFGAAVGLAVQYISTRRARVRNQVIKKVSTAVKGDPVAATDPVLIKGPRFWQAPIPEGMGKLMWPEGRDVAVHGVKLSESDGSARMWAYQRVRLALKHVQERVMTNFPELSCSLEVTSCRVQLLGKSGRHFSAQAFPFLVISRADNHSSLTSVRDWLYSHRGDLEERPMTAFVHHLSQPDPATGEVFLPAEEAATLRRAFFARHPSADADPSVAIPPMGRPAEELLQQLQQPLGSSSAARGAGLGGGASYPGAGATGPDLWGSTGVLKGMPPVKKDLPDPAGGGVDKAPNPATIV